MMRSLSSAVAGLRTHQTKMDVIGNNIANVNTYGFKASRTVFEDIFYQSLSSASGPVGTTKGGVNPTQIGYGSSVATIDVLNSQTGGVSTNRAMDVYITGDGYLVTNDGYGNLTYTRLGALYFDEEGNLVDGEGKFIQGFPMRPGEDGLDVPDIPANGKLTDKTLLSNIKIDPELMKNLTNIQITDTGMVVATLPGESQVKIGSAAPDWMDAANATVPEDSNLTGNITFKIRAEFSAEQMTTAIRTLTGDADASVSNVEFSNDLCLDAENLKLTAGSDGVFYLSGTYTNASGKKVTFTTTATSPDTNSNLVFKHNGNELCSMQISNYDPISTIQPGYYDNRDASFPADTGTTPSNLEFTEALIAAGVTSANVTKVSQLLPEANHVDFSNATLGVTYASAANPGDPDSVTITIDTTIPDNYYDNRNATVTATGGGGTTVSETDVATALQQLGLENVSVNNFLTQTQPPLNLDGATFAITSYDATAGVGLSITDTTGASYTATYTNANAISFADAGGTTVLTINLGNALTLPVPGEPRTYTATFDPATVADAPIVFEDANGAETFSVNMSGTFPAPGDTGNNFSGREYDFPLLTYQYNASVLDKGENIHYFPDDSGVSGPDVWGDIPPAGFSFGDVYIPITGSASSSFNGTIGSVQVNEGEQINVGCIILAKFPNNGGLDQVGTTGFSETVNSGVPEFLKPGSDGVGALKSAQLEMSNVDISQEFTDMITTQRGFQANTRIVTVSDEMLEELVNLKR